jgi:hypothetical protein
MRTIVGERCSSHASAACWADVLSAVATPASVSDCKGANPPSGKNGAKAMFSSAHRSTSSSSCLWAML